MTSIRFGFADLSAGARQQPFHHGGAMAAMRLLFALLRRRFASASLRSVP